MALTPGSYSLQQAADSISGSGTELGEALEDMTRDVGDSPQADILIDLENDPLDLNRATKEELQQVPEITPLMARNIFLRRLRARFKKVDDLLEIEGFNVQLLSRVRKYLTVQSDTERGEYIVMRSRSSRRLESVPRDQPAESIVSPWKAYYRLLGGFGHLPIRSGRDAAFGVLMERDEGERSANGFSSAFAVLSLFEPTAKIVIGDFIMEAAQGLVFSRPRTGSKGNDVTGIVGKNSIGLSPYSSTDETAFFRGIGLSVHAFSLTSAVFYSSKPVHGALDSNGVIAGMYSSGLFRTPAELARRNVAREQVLGLRVSSVSVQGVTVGVTGSVSTFSHPVSLSRTSEDVFRHLSIVGADVSYTGSQIGFQTEAARDNHGGFGMIGGANLKAASDIDIALLFRHYANGYVQLHASGFAESPGMTMDETGMYIGATAGIARWITIRMYYDQFMYPGGGARIHGSVVGNDFLCAVLLGPFEQNTLTIQYRRKGKSVLEINSDSLGREIRLAAPGVQDNFRVNLVSKPSTGIRMMSRVELVHVGRLLSGYSESGVLVFQDVSADLFRMARIDLRAAFFDTKSYDSRIYEFESELQGTFANPALYGKGIRWYCILRLDLSRNLRLSAKYSRSLRESAESDQSAFHAGVQEEEGMVSVQVDFSF